jgi:heme-degrading monooxygenase HmoA
MIAAFVTFRYGNDFDAAKLKKTADSARGRFEGMPGLRQKAFTVKPATHEAVNVYLWQSEEAARAFFSAEMLDRVTGLYGVRPTIEYAEIAALVDNG